MSVRRISLPLLLAVLAQPLLAETLPEVVVTETRTTQTADAALASVTVITRDEIERRQPRSVQALLRSVPGVHVGNSGGEGKQSSVFLRGTESDHVLVLIDGVKVGSASAGQTAFEQLPVALIERIEVVRGPRSSLYGSEAIGGVIQIFTRRGGGPVTPSFSTTVGSDDTVAATAGLRGGGERGWFNLGVSGRRTDGFDACRNVATAGCFAIEPDDDGYRSRSATLRTGYRFANGAELDLHALHAEGDTEFDGGFQNQSETLQQVFGASLQVMPTADWDSRLQLGRSRDESDNYLNGTFASRFDTERDTLSWQNDFYVGDAHLVTLGVDHQEDRVDSSTAFTRTSRDNTGLFAQYQGDYPAGRAQLALRHDNNEQFGDQVTGSVGWLQHFGNGLEGTLTYGTAFKAPTFNDLYFPGFSNPNLEPEKSASIEAGLRGPLPHGSWSLAVYQTRIDQLIAFNPLPVNINEARIRGLEAVGASRIAGWDLDASLTLLEPEDRSGGANHGNLLPRRAEQTLQLDLYRDFGRYSLGASLHAEGRRFDNLANTQRLDGYATIDLLAEYALGNDWRLLGRLENLLDQDYESVAFYEQPGRGLFVTLRYDPR